MTYHSHEAGNARTLNLQDVVVWGNSEIITAKSERHIWQAITLVTLNSVLSVVSLLGTNFLVQKLSKSSWESDEGSSSVQDNTSSLERSLRLAEGDSIEINLPVSLASQWDVGQLAGEVVLVDATEGSLRVVSILGVAKVESENGLIQETLLNHVVEWWGNLVDGDGVISKTKDTIETAECESKTWLLSSLSEKLVLDLQVTNCHGILRNETAKAARAISDLE